MAIRNVQLFKTKWTDPKTGELRESPVWSYSISFQGRRYRGTTGQVKKTIAWAAAEDKLKQIERALAGLPVEDSRQRIRTVAEMIDDYAAKYKASHRPRAYDLVAGRGKTLKKHLGSLLAAELTEKRIAQYMAMRQAAGVGPRSINIEVGVLCRALGGTWRGRWPGLKPMREPKDVGRALTDEEVSRLFRAAAASPSPYIQTAILLAVSTGMRSGEIFDLTWGAVDFEREELKVLRSKTRGGEGRVIPMNATVKAALESYAAGYAGRFGGLKPEWYLFAACSTKRPADPWKPVTSLKTAWNWVKARAGVEARFHDLRHTAASRMGRAGASRAAMMRVLGHASQSLVDHYCHAEERDLREAVKALDLAGDCQSACQSEPNRAKRETAKSFVM